jgi:hypothetical protein
LSDDDTGILAAYGLLGRNSHERFLPQSALLASGAYRQMLLYGLMDSDGSMTGASSSVYYTSSEQLADDVAMLVRSLGGHASIWSHDPTYTYRGDTRQGRHAYRVNIRTAWNPFLHHGRNRQKWDDIESRRKTKRQHVAKKVGSVVDTGVVASQCLMLDCDDHLYVTRGGVLTHNTAASFNVWNDIAHMSPQLKTYMLLDRLTSQRDGIPGRIDGGIFRLLRKVKRGPRATPPFYEDMYISHNDFTLRAFWTQLAGILQDVYDVRTAIDSGADPMRVAYPNPTRDCKWECPFFQICPLFDDGSDVESALADQFVVADPYDYYNDTSDGEKTQ